MLQDLMRDIEMDYGKGPLGIAKFVAATLLWLIGIYIVMVAAAL